MKSVLLFFGLFLFSISSLASTAISNFSCHDFLSGVGPQNSNATEVYINLIKDMIQNKNAISTSALLQILDFNDAVNPIDVIDTSLNTEQKFAFQSAFEKLLTYKNNLDWNKIKNELERLKGEREETTVQREEARRKTAHQFKPKFIREVKYDGAQGNVKLAFVLPDGTPMVVYKERNGLAKVVNLQSGIETTLGLINEFGSEPFYSSTSRAYFFGLGRSSFNLFEVNEKHEVKTVIGDYKVGAVQKVHGKAIAGQNGELHIFSQEGSSGLPKVLADLSAFRENKPKLKMWVTIGYLEVELGTDRKKHFPLPDVEGASADVKPNGHIFSYFFEKEDQLTILDLTTNALVKEIPVPESFKKRDELYSVGSIDNLVIPNFESGKVAQWIEIKTGKLIDVSDQVAQMPSPLVLIPTAQGYQIIYENEVRLMRTKRIRTVALYNNIVRKMEIYKIPEKFDSAHSEILKLKNGTSLLLVGSDTASQSKTLVWFPLDGGIPMKLDVTPFKVTSFIKAWETTDGHILGLFDGETGFKVIQIYGPENNNE